MRRLLTAGLAAAGTLAMVGTLQTAALANLEGTQPVITEAITRSHQDVAADANAAELYNPTDSSIDISNWVLRFYDSGGTVITSVQFGVDVAPTSIPANGFITVADPNYSPNPSFTGTVVNYTNVSGTDEFPDTGGVALFNNSNTRVDGLAMTASHPALEGEPEEELNANTDAAGQTAGHEVTIQRDVVAHDSDDNLDDFDRHLSNWGALG